ncbi:low temperature requirement protein A [Micromonospora vinacea]|uniref:Low temperature requirement protein LtrA n=1 Tax=Micromonospora vinacea TaxID=709878 RepID=A0ABS0JZB2_9ACTN|nr:low temperature requirement protein A [Micromonospora vinacea]MBG6101675.1 low temperature requirement protein LtrA [Micromonospora vinacea]WSZ75499.1 low temperature requirement protein A [Micromonospora sp. NBC_00860]
MASRPERLLRGRDAPLSASFLELFFDLAFVLALSQLAEHLLHDLTLAGTLRTALLLVGVWWIWVTTTWTADWYDPDTPIIRAVLVAATLGSLLTGVAIPQALHGRAGLFAGAYVAVHLVRGVITVSTLRGHPRQRRALRILCWYSVTAIPWLAGVFLPEWRVVLWASALAIDLSGPRLGWPTPMLGRARQQELRLAGEHFAERYQQIMIITLGELVLVAGLSYSGTRLDPAETAAFLLVFATAVLIGLLYVTPAGQHLGSAIEHADTSRLGVIAGYLHLVMIAGIVLTAVGAELSIAHPTEVGDTKAVMVILGGPALFLVGRILFSLAIHRRLSWPRLGALLLLGGAAAAVRMPLLAVSAVATGVVLAVAVLDNAGIMSYRRPRSAD